MPMEGTLDLQRSLEQVQGILTQRQDEVQAKVNANTALRNRLGHSKAQRVELGAQLASVRVHTARLEHEAAAQEAGLNQTSELRLVGDVAGLKTRLSSLNTRKDQLQSACRKEIERLAYFKRLVKSTSCAGTVVGSEQLLCEIKQQLAKKEREMELLDMPKQISTLQTALSQKQEAVSECKVRLEALQASNQACREQIYAQQQELQELKEQQSGLHACRQQLQKLSWECEDAVKRLTGHKSARAIAHAQHDSLRRQISTAKHKIMQLVG